MLDEGEEEKRENEKAAREAAIEEQKQRQL